MKHEAVELLTADGTCPAQVFVPADGGAHPAVVMYTDAFGVRPATEAIARRLADEGYVVLLPDIFYRAQPYDPIDPSAAFASGDVRGTLAPLMGTTDNLVAAADSETFLDYVFARDDVVGDRACLVGYCMGGAIALTVAGVAPDRVGAVAAFHTGRLLTDDETSPHLVADRISAPVYIGGADDDAAYTPEMAREYDDILERAGVPHRSEIYAGALHGYAIPDFPVYSEEASARHWRELLTFFGATIGARAA